MSTQDIQKPEIPPEVQANFKRRLKLAYHKRNKVHQVFFSTSKYDKTKKRSVEKRHYVGQIKDGKFSYTTGYLLKQLQQRLEALEQSSSSDDGESKSHNKENQSETGDNATTVKVLDVVSAIKDNRQPGKVVYRLDHVLLVSLLSALGGHTSCVAIADYWKNHRPFLEKALPHFPETDIAHDTVRRILMIASPKGLKDLFSKMVEPLIKLVAGRTVAVDGQAIRATGEADKKTAAATSSPTTTLKTAWPSPRSWLVRRRTRRPSRPP